MKILRGVQPGPRRVLLYGQHGCGKSTWASQAPSPIFLDLEDGINDLDCDKTEHIKSLIEVRTTLEALAGDDYDYKTLVIDSVDWLEHLIHKQVAEDAGTKTIADVSFGKGYPAAVKYWSQIIGVLDLLRTRKRMGIVMLSHAKIERFDSPESDGYDRYAPDLHKSSSGMIQEWVDEVLFASFRVYVKKEDAGFNKQINKAIGGKERYIRTSESASAVAKNRLGLPDELPMHWSAYADCIKASYAKAKPFVSVGNIAGVVVDGSSKTAEQKAFQAEVAAEAAEVF